jgi:hypothetical protein
LRRALGALAVVAVLVAAGGAAMRDTVLRPLA